jgi:hypothetical protein
MFQFCCLLFKNSGEKRKDQPKDEAAAGSCAGLQQGNIKAHMIATPKLAVT